MADFTAGARNAKVRCQFARITAPTAGPGLTEVWTMRLIDADKLVDMLYDNEFASLCPLDEVSGVIDACPTVDAVPVVRCKDCKSCRKLNRKDRIEEAYAEGVLWCKNQSDGVWPDDFCSYGERKDGDG